MENLNRKTNKPLVAITAGDPNGIGYEVILKTLAEPHILELCRPILYGNLSMVKRHAQYMDNEIKNLNFTVIQNPEQATNASKLYLISCHTDAVPLNLGTSTKEAGAASLACLQRACRDLQAGKVNALVTAPINKENIQSEDFQYSGHTEYLTHLFGKTTDSLMMMVSSQMRVALVCNHVPIVKVPLFITPERIVTKLKVLNETLQDDFAIQHPRIAVLALNPHAGDNGLLGKEEQTIIAPALQTARQEGVLAFGPYPADGFFGAGMYAQFDAVLGMYHDQVLAPFKTLDMSGVNYTAGLTVVRTSPDHGTAYGLAGKNEASAESFRNAVYMALDLLRTQAQEKELVANKMMETKEENERVNSIA